MLDPPHRNAWFDGGMASTLVLVNGVPGSGKSTLAAELAPVLDATLVSKDRLKESIADALGRSATRDVVTPIAIAAMWSAAARLDGTVVLDSFWFQPRDGGVLQAEIERVAPCRYLEVWCDVPVSEAHLRAVLRRRHRIHHEPTNDEWTAWGTAQPVGISPVVRVDTSSPVHVPALVEQIDAVVGGVTH